jgi:3-deoxy-7-phosphoheptulonate synthase
LGDEGVALIAGASRAAGLPAVVEALAVEQLDVLREHVGMIQIGARNMQNFELLKAAARTGLPVLLKRGVAATLDELLYAAEYILLEGNPNVVLCERGIRGFDSHTRNVFDLAGALRLKELTHLPVIVDPSHAAGKRDYVPSIALAGIAAGAHGIIVEVHYCPSEAQCDGPQALLPETFKELMTQLRAIAAVTRKEFAESGDLVNA